MIEQALRDVLQGIVTHRTVQDKFCGDDEGDGTGREERGDDHDDSVAS